MPCCPSWLPGFGVSASCTTHRRDPVCVVAQVFVLITLMIVEFLNLAIFHPKVASQVPWNDVGVFVVLAGLTVYNFFKGLQCRSILSLLTPPALQPCSRIRWAFLRDSASPMRAMT